MKALAACVPGIAVVLCTFTGCSTTETQEKREVRESMHQPYQNAEQEEPETPGDRRAGPMTDRAGAHWDW